MADLIDFAPVRILTTNALPGVGYQARFFLSGTTTPVTTYTDEALTIAHPVPLLADAAGVFATVWGATGSPIKAVIADADGATVYTVDPVQSISSASGAADVSFAPTAEIPQTDVQAAIEAVDDNWRAGLLSYGVGVTGTATRLSDIDATTSAAGEYRFDATTTGTFPTGVAAASTGAVDLNRITATTGFETLVPADADRLFFRRLATTFQGWHSVLSVLASTIADGDIVVRIAGFWSRLAKGTALQSLRVNAAGTALEYATPIFAKEFISAEQTITTAGTRVLAHGLGAVPKLTTYELVCKTAEAGYSIGAILEIGIMAAPSGSSEYNASAIKDATNITVRYASGANVFNVLHATTGVGVVLTDANWRLVVRAYA